MDVRRYEVLKALDRTGYLSPLSDLGREFASLKAEYDREVFGLLRERCLVPPSER